MKTKTTKQFIKESNKIHKNKYNYSLVKYVNHNSDVDIICPIHGVFKIKPTSHTYFNRGCKKCDTLILNKIKTQRFIEKANKIHNSSKYDYSHTEYVDSREKIKIVCNSHGSFKITPKMHLKGHGCYECLKVTTEDFIKKAKEAHGDLYDYSESNYTGSTNKISIKCRIHGSYMQIAHNHTNGNGCKKCAVDKSSELYSDNTAKFIKKAIKKHGKKYTYFKSEYKRSFNKIIITCSVHGDFEKRAICHLNGQGCPSCSSSGFKPNDSAILYYLSVNNSQAYKIGITNRTVAQRFEKTEDVRIVKIWEYGIGSDAYKEEQRILKEFKYAKWNGENLLISGNSELFKYDILGLDT